MLSQDSEKIHERFELMRNLAERLPHGTFEVFRADVEEALGKGVFDRLTPTLLEHLRQLWCAGYGVGAKSRCEMCGSVDGVARTPAKTAYPWDGTGTNPNADPYLCRPCTNDYVSHWESMWDEYHAGLL